MALLEELAFKGSERALDKQERVLEELRARTGILLAAASLASSLLGGTALAGRPPIALMIVALAAFIVSIVAGVFVLTPRRGLVFAVSGPVLYEQLFAFRHDPAEIHRRLAYELARVWDANDLLIGDLVRAYRIATLAIALEIVVLTILVTGRVF